jgi:hypothetical protein
MAKILIRSRSCFKLRLQLEKREMTHQQRMKVTPKKKIRSRGLRKRIRRRRNRSKWKRLKRASMIERRAKIARLYTLHPVSQKRRWVGKVRKNRLQYLKFRISSKDSQ